MRRVFARVCPVRRIMLRRCGHCYTALVLKKIFNLPIMSQRSFDYLNTLVSQLVIICAFQGVALLGTLAVA